MCYGHPRHIQDAMCHNLTVDVVDFVRLTHVNLFSIAHPIFNERPSGAFKRTPVLLAAARRLFCSCSCACCCALARVDLLSPGHCRWLTTVWPTRRKSFCAQTAAVRSASTTATAEAEHAGDRTRDPPRSAGQHPSCCDPGETGQTRIRRLVTFTAWVLSCGRSCAGVRICRGTACPMRRRETESFDVMDNVQSVFVVTSARASAIHQSGDVVPEIVIRRKIVDGP